MLIELRYGASKAQWWWQWSPESTDMQLDPLAQSMTWEVWPNLDIGVNLDFDFYQTKSLSFGAHWWEDNYVAWISALRPLLTELWKNQPLAHWPDFWGHWWTWDLKFGHQSLRLVTADMLVFLLGSSLVRDVTARGVVTLPRLGCMLNTVTSGDS